MRVLACLRGKSCLVCLVSQMSSFYNVFFFRVFLYALFSYYFLCVLGFSLFFFLALVTSILNIGLPIFFSCFSFYDTFFPFCVSILLSCFFPSFSWFIFLASLVMFFNLFQSFFFFLPLIFYLVYSLSISCSSDLSISIFFSFLKFPEFILSPSSYQFPPSFSFFHRHLRSFGQRNELLRSLLTFTLGIFAFLACVVCGDLSGAVAASVSFLVVCIRRHGVFVWGGGKSVCVPVFVEGGG